MKINEAIYIGFGTIMNKEVSISEVSDYIKTFLPGYCDVDIKLIRRRVGSYLARNINSDKPLYIKIKSGVYKKRKNLGAGKKDEINNVKLKTLYGLNFYEKLIAVSNNEFEIALALLKYHQNISCLVDKFGDENEFLKYLEQWNKVEVERTDTYLEISRLFLEAVIDRMLDDKDRIFDDIFRMFDDYYNEKDSRKNGSLNKSEDVGNLTRIILAKLFNYFFSPGNYNSKLFECDKIYEK